MVVLASAGLLDQNVFVRYSDAFGDFKPYRTVQFFVQVIPGQFFNNHRNDLNKVLFSKLSRAPLAFAGWTDAPFRSG